MTTASIIGWGETSFGELPKQDYHDLVEEAAYEALERADLRPSDVDGFITTSRIGQEGSSVVEAATLAEHLGLMPGLRYASLGAVGGATHIQHIAQAAQAIDDGFVENVLILSVDNLATGIGRDAAIQSMANVGHPEFEQPYGPLIPSMYALAAQKHMDAFDTTPRQLAKVASIAYEHAAKQPEHRSQTHTEKTPEEILDSPMIATPLTLDQCSLISDGGGAIVVTDTETAHEQHDSPVDVLGVGEYSTHESISQTPNLTETGAKQAGNQAFRQAGVTHDEIDVIEIYDCFTITVLLALEDLGFCEKGTSGDLVESGDLELGGKWPMNTHGGELAQAHPGSPAGMMHITEAIRQLRGEAGETQVRDATTALVHGNGGILSTQSAAIFQRGDYNA